MKKITSWLVVAAVTVVGVSLLPVVVSAQSVSASVGVSGSIGASGSPTVASLEAQITALLSELASLQAHAGMPASTSTMPWNLSSTVPIVGASSTVSCHSFNRNLSIGSQGSDVTQLQTMLSQDANFPTGDITGYFGPITAHALASFQVSNDIAASSSATGFFGPLTRNFLQFHCPGTPLPIVPPAQPMPPSSSTMPIPLPFQPGGPILPPTPPGSASSTTGAMISPTSGPVGTSVMITGVATNELGTTETVLMNGLVAAPNVAVASDGSVTFTVPGSLAPNCGFAPMTACPMFMALTTARTYSVSIINPSSTNALLVGDFTVTGGIGLNPGPVALPPGFASSTSAN
jgi:peptidoglycan hydrolase-like protein with peptidoglycan-binding domain